MPERLDYPTGDLEYGQEVQITKSAPIQGAGADHAWPAQNTLSTTAELILAEAPLRSSAVILNTDASISVYVGIGGVTSSNGFVLKAGASMTITYRGDVYAVAASGTPVICIWDEWVAL